MIWGRLFEYLDDFFYEKDVVNCYHDYSFIRTFCKKNEINFDEFQPILEVTGGYCDCEVYFNTNRIVDHNSEIPLLKYKVNKSATN